MFPSPKELVDHPKRICEALLIRTLASTSFEDKIGGGLLVERVVAEEGDDGGPLRNHWLSFITLPALVNLTKSAELSRYIFLTQVHRQPLIAKVLTESLGWRDEAFLFENECFKRF